ncbi:MAG: ABC transporter permease [Planctomycetota bacterium]
MIRSRLLAWGSQYGGLLGVLGLLVVVFAVSSENFLQTSTVVVIANQIPALTFVTIGMTFVLAVAGIDLSVGSMLALSCAVFGVLMKQHDWPIGAAFVVAMLVAGLCGTVNGMISVGFHVPSFIVTLGMLEIARGATKVVTDSESVFIGSRVEWFSQPSESFPFSPAFLTAILFVVLGQFVLKRTVFGRYCIAIGTNAEAVRLSGIRVAPWSIAVFTISGLMCGLASLAQASRLEAADPNGAIGIELAAIAACVIGGTSLMGGRASVVHSFIGVLIIQVLETGLAQIGVSDAKKQIITGVVIVVAVLFDAIRTRWKRK